MKVQLLPFFSVILFTLTSFACASTPWQDPRWLVIEGATSGSGIGENKRVVFLAGDEEYRSEECLPMLAKILSKQHGFQSIVLFSQNDNGEINPDNSHNIPGLELLDDADLLVMQLRFRELPDEHMAKIIDYVNSGRPLIGIRTSTHPFNYKASSESPYAKWSWRSKNPAGGFGKEIFGETWVAHHGQHGKQATRGIANENVSVPSLMNGVRDVFGPTDVYAINKLPKDSEIVLRGAVLDGMSHDSEINAGVKNDPMHPIAWIRNRQFISKDGNKSEQRIFMTTMGAAQDWLCEDLRRLFVNAVAWSLGCIEMIPEKGLSADLVGDYQPSPFGFGDFVPGKFPKDYAK